MVAVNSVVSFKLLQGFSAETSGSVCVHARVPWFHLTNSFPGGLLVCLPADAAAAFISEISSLDNMPAWIVGEVIAGACE